MAAPAAARKQHLASCAKERRMSLMDIVLGMIEERPGCTVDDLMPDLPQYSRQQVKQAMQNLSFTDRARCVRQGVRGRRKGAKPGRYYPIEREPMPGPFAIPRVANSVFQLGALA
jgi:hypothetical protein